jgi:uncharacterized protein YegJ (DUF2314 family)
MEDFDWDKKNIINIDVSGKSYLEAIEIAQQTLWFFIKVLQSNDANDFKFYIKVKFEDDRYIEHLWLIPTSIDEDKFTAVIDNIPNNLKHIKYKDIKQIYKKDVEDWIIRVRESEILGNFIFNSLQEN